MRLSLDHINLVTWLVITDVHDKLLFQSREKSHFFNSEKKEAMERIISLEEKEYQFLQTVLNLMTKYDQITVEELRAKLGDTKHHDASPRWSCIGENSVYRKVRPVRLRGEGKLASEILVEERNQ